MKYLLVASAVGVFSIVALARPVPIGERKYVIPEVRSQSIQIVNESEKVKGNYMRDPIAGGSGKTQTAKIHGKGHDDEPKAPAVVHTEKAFKPLAIEGRLLQPRVEFEPEYLDISQMEAISEPKFAESLMENLDALE